MEHTAENMARFLGNQATDEEAQKFAAFLIGKGWTLENGEDGQLEAYKDGQKMTEQEWVKLSGLCFN